MTTEEYSAPSSQPPQGKSFRTRTPTLLQMEAVECGAAALGIIMHHYDVWVSLEKLRVECGVSRDGSKAGNIIRVARNYGFEAEGYKVEAAEVFEDKEDLPCIIFWEFNHFLVVEGFKKDKVFLNDPACGPRTVSWEEFDKKFTGVALVLHKGENFKKIGKKPALMGGLLSRIGRGKSTLFLVILASLALVLPGIAAPVFSRIFVDDIMVGGALDWIWPLLAGIGATFFIKTMLSWIQGYYLLRLQTSLAVKECSRFMWHIMRLPVQFFLQRYGAEIGTRVSLNNQVVSFISGELASAFVGMLTAVFYLAVMLQYDAFLTCLAVLAALISVTGIQLFWRWQTDVNMHLLQEGGKLSSLTMGGLQMMQTIKACGLEDDFFSKWSGYYARYTTISNLTSQKIALYKLIPDIFMTLNSVAVLIAGGLKVMSGELSIGGLLAFQMLSGAFLAAVGQFVGLGSSLASMKANISRIEDVLAYEAEDILNQDERKVVKRISGNIQVENVTFGYNKFEPPVVKNFSLELKPGKRIALVGGSGSGKSTVARIISGLLLPWEGTVLFDGLAREDYDRAALANSLAVVDQNIFLFSGTIKENLTLWDDSITESEILQAAKDSCIYADLVNRAGGVDAAVVEGGNNFSGGQRQRLEIARALCRQPSVLILDEATSALDPMTESMVDNCLRRRGCSCIIVAHRLSTIRDADEIIVLEKGEIIQRGTHEELLNDKNPYYATLIGDN